MEVAASHEHYPHERTPIRIPVLAAGNSIDLADKAAGGQGGLRRFALGRMESAGAVAGGGFKKIKFSRMRTLLGKLELPE